MMINNEILLESGYKEYQPNKIFYPYANRFFQKRIRNDKGHTKYFINFVEYGGDGKKDIIYNVDLQFEKENYTMDITMFTLDSKLTLEEIEKEIYSIWYGLVVRKKSFRL